MRAFSLLFAFISLVLLVQLVAYLIIGPVQTVFVVALLVGFAACAGAALYLLKPYEDRDALQKRRELWRARRGLDGSDDESEEHREDESRER
ncbi:hypothetical protein [Rubrobacter aplysinae]|uniref:hypothetical protein n=1 Tax=Rubrobacter aplysinae TaxID=909625 RepID=UPI00064C3386|nr:hypothetical protein [Rubrobacter aplysinae]